MTDPLRVAGRDKVAVLISSCDAYSDLWRPYFTFFFRYWPDCPFPVYLVTNCRTFPDERVRSLPVGHDGGWAECTRRALERLPGQYLIYSHEDFFLDRPVSTSRILALVAYFERRGAAYLRLYPCPGPDVVCHDNPEVGEIRRGGPYRVSLQAALWRKDVLISLLRDGENAWQMEVRGSRRSDELGALFLSAVRGGDGLRIVDPPLSYFCTAVDKGLWTREALRFCERERVPVDLSARKVETWRTDLSQFVGRFVGPPVRALKQLVWGVETRNTG